MPTVLILSAVPLCSAQTNDEINAGLQFNFLRPGARALALGNAFVGLDYDATFAFTNPAGLWLAPDPGVSAEFRHGSYVTRYIDGGSGGGSISGRGLDVDETLRFSDYDSSTDGIAFLSFVYPTRFASFAVFRHELSNFSARIDDSQGAFLGPADARGRVAAVRGDLELDIPGVGGAVSFAVARRFWVGIGLTRYELDFSATTRRIDVRRLTEDGDLVVGFEPVDPDGGTEFDRHLQHGDDADWTATLGLIWESRDRKWSLGASYRQGPQFEMDYRVEFQPWAFHLRDLGVDLAADPRRAAVLAGTTKFDVPDVLSLGMAVKPTASVLIALEYARVGYSSLDPEANILHTLVAPDPDGDGFVVLEDEVERFSVPDGDEFHLGIEYRLQHRWQIDLRLGGWYDPDHQLRYDGPRDALYTRFAPGDDEVHVTAGTGILVRRLGLNFDVGIDYSDRGTIVSLSIGKRVIRPWD